MSAEGDTNLDNDGAGDVLAYFSENLFARIEALIRHPRGHEYDDGYISELFALIEVAFALHDRELLNFTPSSPEFLGSFEPFQQRWASYHRAAGHEPPEERARTMGETFARLDQICRARMEEFDVQDSEAPDESRGTVEQSNLHRELQKIFENLQR